MTCDTACEVASEVGRKTLLLIPVIAILLIAGRVGIRRGGAP
jgi:hypothetical protein